MKRFIGKTILVQEADNSSSPIYRMVVVEAVDSDTYRVADLGVVQRARIATPPQELRDWMNRNGFKQNELATILCVHQATVSYWLSGKRKIPESVRKMMNIADTGLGSMGDKLRKLQAMERGLLQVLEQLRTVKVIEGGSVE